MSMSKTELNEAMRALFARLVKGDDEELIADAFGLELEEYESLKAKMLDKKGKASREAPPEHVFVEYMINQLRNVEDLTKLLDTLETSYRTEGLHKVAPAMVAAIKARSSIHTEILNTGQSMGVFKKEPAKLVGGILVADLGREALQAKITDALSGLSKLMGRYGDDRFMDKIIEADSLHEGPILPELAESLEPDVIVAPPSKPKKHAKAAHSKTSAHARGARVR